MSDFVTPRVVARERGGDARRRPLWGLVFGRVLSALGYHGYGDLDRKRYDDLATQQNDL